MMQKFFYSIYSNLVYLLIAGRYFWQGWLHPKLISTVLWSFKVTEKPCFELSHRSNIAERHWNLLNLTAIFIASPMKKNIFSSSSYHWVNFLWICWHTEKLWIQQQNILCLLEIQTRPLFFSLHKIQMGKQHRMMS